MCPCALLVVYLSSGIYMAVGTCVDIKWMQSVVVLKRMVYM